MDFLEYKGYKGSVEYSKEDNCLFGKVQGQME
jgi:predicted HicB family RNase H-like nuclease